MIKERIKKNVHLIDVWSNLNMLENCDVLRKCEVRILCVRLSGKVVARLNEMM